MTALVLVVPQVMPGAITKVMAAGSTCATSKPGFASYQVRVCFTSPESTEDLQGITWISTSVLVDGTDPGIRRAVFYLNGAYLLTDYQAPYAFKLPTARWVDGRYKLEMRLFMRDGFATGKAAINVRFQNGISSQPVNEKHFTPSAGSPAAPGEPFVVMATGDGAGGETSATEVVNMIEAQKPNLLLYLGDVYEKGTPTEFFNWFGDQGAYFSRFRSITNPTVGNHEYSASTAADGYFDYWDNIPQYYSFDAGGWHFVSLNSNTRRAALYKNSQQYAWLDDDLSRNAGKCTIVYFHHPYFNVGSEGDRPTLGDVWQLMVQHHVSIVLAGHEHNYQRWVPLDGSGSPNPTGITELVVGGGGHGVQEITKHDSRVAFTHSGNPDALGALKLSLSARAAHFDFTSITGEVLDSGTVNCN